MAIHGTHRTRGWKRYTRLLMGNVARTTSIHARGAETFKRVSTERSSKSGSSCSIRDKVLCGVAQRFRQQHLDAQLFQLVLVDGFDGGGSSDRHKGGRLYVSMRRGENSCPGPGGIIASDNFEASGNHLEEFITRLRAIAEPGWLRTSAAGPTLYGWSRGGIAGEGVFKPIDSPSAPGPTRWHAARRPGPTSRSSGSSTRALGSTPN